MNPLKSTESDYYIDLHMQALAELWSLPTLNCLCVHFYNKYPPASDFHRPGSHLKKLTFLQHFTAYIDLKNTLPTLQGN